VGKTKKPTPEQEAEWREQQRELAKLIEARKERYRTWLEVQARRRARLRRLSFGLLGRE
jgi:hypothetical protein